MLSRRSLLGAALGATCLAVPAFAGATDPLFVNLTTDDPHRAMMGIGFAQKQLERGHPVSIFFNDRGVHVVSLKHAGTFSEHQKVIAGMLAKGGQIIACPTCIKHFGIAEADLVPGAVVGNPELTGEALFRDNGKTLTW
jgi:predicted peroxiredoxin